MIPKKVYINIAVWDEGRKYDFIEVSERPHQTTDTQCHWREYTDLSQVWHDTSEEPEGNYCDIIHQDENGCCWLESKADIMRLYDTWNEFTEVEMIIRWAYVSDLLPKGGEI